MRRFWTEAERDTLRLHYHDLSGPELAAKLGRSTRAVYQEAQSLGLRKVHRVKTGLAFQAEVRRLNAAGWPDHEIATELGCERHTVSTWRKRLGLPSNARGERFKTRIRAGVARQLAAAGLSTLAEVRVEAFRKFAREGGWPADLPPRAVQILDALSERGPMTRRQIADAIGLPWRGSRRSLKCKGPGGSYLAELMARGLVVSLGRMVRTGGKGNNVHLYSLALTTERFGDGDIQAS